ncbi:hypothetical protein B484DRAFT_393414, partial [Ochromonadaceae sp. CCMP2298]
GGGVGGWGALEAVIELSGEVVGLKPPAVAAQPMDPRVFVHEVGCLQILASLHLDVQCTVGDVCLQPPDIGPATLHSYYMQRRQLGRRGDAFTFEEVFGHRHWLPHSTPAAALAARTAGKRKGKAGPPLPPPRMYETLSLVEQQPLSQEGFGLLA